MCQHAAICPILEWLLDSAIFYKKGVVVAYMVCLECWHFLIIYHGSILPLMFFLLFWCSVINDADLLKILDLPILVVLDEAYIEFSGLDSKMAWVKKYENLIVLRTFSKRAGMFNILLCELNLNRQVLEIGHQSMFLKSRHRVAESLFVCLPMSLELQKSYSNGWQVNRISSDINQKHCWKPFRTHKLSSQIHYRDMDMSEIENAWLFPQHVLEKEQYFLA